jgi:hypothetical protein
VKIHKPHTLRKESFVPLEYEHYFDVEEEKMVLTQKHHRRPRSLKGSDDPSNISFVPPELHKEWHIMFGNMNAIQICQVINNYSWKPEDKILKCRFINGSRVKKRGRGNSHKEQRCQQAWDKMFKGLDFYQAINYINSVWLDPSYHFYVRRKK